MSHPLFYPIIIKQILRSVLGSSKKKVEFQTISSPFHLIFKENLSALDSIQINGMVLNPLTGGFFLCFRWVFSLGKKNPRRVVKKKICIKFIWTSSYTYYTSNQRKLNALLEKGGCLHYFLHMWKQYRLDLLGLGNAPLSSKSLSLDLDSPSSFWKISLDRDSLELKSLSHSSRLFSLSSSCKFLKSSLAWSAVSLRLLSLATAKLRLQINVDLHNVFKFWSFYHKADSKDEQLCIENMK